jgi:hypothetical protein
VLSGNEVALFNGALLAVAAFPFEIKLHALAPALPANRADISCQCLLLFTSPLPQGRGYLVRFTALAGLLPADSVGRDPETALSPGPDPDLVLRLYVSLADDTRCEESA